MSTLRAWSANETPAAVVGNENGPPGLVRNGRCRAEFENGPLPTGAWSAAALFPFWDDLYPIAAGDVYAQTLGTAPNRVFIVQWHEIMHIASSEDPVVYPASFQAALCEGSNNIVFQYLDVVFGDPLYPENDEGGSATVGI